MSRFAVEAVGAVVVSGLFAGSALAVQSPGGVGGRPFFDSRSAVGARVDGDVRVARLKADQGLGVLGTVATDRETGGVSSYQSVDGFLTGAGQDDAADVVLGFVAERQAVFGLDRADVDGLTQTARDVSPDGITHLRWVQMAAGVPSFDSGIEGHVDAKGRLIAVQGGAQPDLKLGSAAPSLSASAALAVARADAGGSGVSPAARGGRGIERRTVFSTGERASLVAFATGTGGRLGWSVTVDGPDPFAYQTVVDASSGEVLYRSGLTNFLSEASTFDLFPGAAAGPGGSGGVVRTQNLGADPLWLDDSAANTRLAGNNTHTYSDLNANNVADGEPNDGNVPAGASDGDGGPDWLFARTLFPAATPCPANGSGCSWDSADPTTRLTNRAQAAANLFVQTNRFHDYLLGNGIGFDEASGNFEQVNSSGAGLGNDRVLAEADDGGGTNNANFATPADGSAPRMQMFMWNTVDVNGSEDATVIYHEYTHGLTNRLVTNSAGGGTIGSSNQGASMGEGYSDFYAMDYLAFQGFVADNAATPGEIKVGEYVFNNAVTGIRAQAMDCAVADTLAAACQGAGNGGYQFTDIPGLVLPHGIGVAWSQVLWQIRQAIAASDGNPALSVAEHTELMAIITGGLRLAPDGPNFVTMRDAILQQAVAMGGARYQLLWTVFADRLLGSGASTTGSSTSAVGSGSLPDGVRHRSTTIDDGFAAGGDGDGAVEAGEQFVVRELLENIGFTAESPISGTLSALTPGTSVDASSSAWPAIAGLLGTASNIDDFRVTAPAAIACDGSQSLSLSLALSTPDGPVTVPITVPISASGFDGPATDGVALPIPDSPLPGILKTIVITDSATIADLNLRLNIRHTFVGDLVITLQHDAGPQVTLVDRPNGTGGNGANSGDNFTNTVLDDEASTFLDAAPVATAPFAGRFKPSSPLSAFDGQNTAGIWTIRVTDLLGADVGFFDRANLNVDGPLPCVVERPTATTEPATAVTTASATLNGSAGAGPGLKPTDSRFVYGTSTAYGSSTPVVPLSAIAPAALSATPTGLAPNTVYHYRIETLRGGVLAVPGIDRTFTTDPLPAPAVTPPVTSASGTPLVRRRISFATTGKLITLSRKGTFGLRFGAAAGTKGTFFVRVRFTPRTRTARSSAKSKVVTLVASKSFTANSAGKVAFKRIRVSRSALRKLPRKTLRLAATLEVRAGGAKFTHKFTLKRSQR